MIKQLERTEIAGYAKKLVGSNFLFGGCTPESGFDNPGFVKYVVEKSVGIILPHSAHAQLNFGIDISKEKLSDGDLVFFAINGGRSVNHVGIYIGNDEFVAAYSGDVMSVAVFNMGEGTKWARAFCVAKRFSY